MHDLRKHFDQLFIIGVLGPNLHSSNLGQAFQRDVAEFGFFQEPGSKCINDVGLEDVAQGDPTQEFEQCFEGSFDQTRLIGSIQDLLAQLEDGRKFGGHGVLEVLCLSGSHLVGRIIKDFLREKTEDRHVVFADGKIRMACRDNLVDERWPVVWPFLLQDRNEDEVELVEKGSLTAKTLFCIGGLDNDAHNEVAYA